MTFKYPSTQSKPYTKEGIAQATTGVGVYGIFNRTGQCIYIGKTEDESEGIQGRVRKHYNGQTVNSYCINRTHSPSYFTWDDVTDCSGDIPNREKELVREYKAKGEAFCNDRVG